MSAHSTDAIRKSIQKKRALQNYNGIFCREHNKKIDVGDPKVKWVTHVCREVG